MSDPTGFDLAAEAAWIRALKEREPWAWERLHREAVDPVFAYVMLRCGRREDAEDLTAEVFAAAVGAIDGFRGEARVVTWLISIARRKLLDSDRRRRRRPEVLASDLGTPDDPAAEWAFASQPDSGAGPPDMLLAERERGSELRELVLRLPEAQREAVLLHCVDDLPLREVALVLRRSENAVKGLLHRAKGALLRHLGSDRDELPAGATAPRQEVSDVAPAC